MTIQEMQDRKRELGLSNQQLSELTGIPVPTLQKIFSGSTKSPRRSTIQALEQALSRTSVMTGDTPAATYLHGAPSALSVAAEAPAAYAAVPVRHTIEEIYALPDGVRAELIDGQIYYMASPTRIHQDIIGELYLSIANHIRARGGRCKVYLSPFAVFLFGDDSTYVEPDLIVVCDPDKVEERGCVGAPDWVMEVISPSSSRMDRILKLGKYREAGVREYWTIDPKNRMVTVYLFDPADEEKEQAEAFSFEDSIPSHTIPDLQIRLADSL